MWTPPSAQIIFDDESAGMNGRQLLRKAFAPLNVQNVGVTPIRMSRLRHSLKADFRTIFVVDGDVATHLDWQSAHDICRDQCARLGDGFRQCAFHPIQFLPFLVVSPAVAVVQMEKESRRYPTAL
jgi:hypothetical protein